MGKASRLKIVDIIIIMAIPLIEWCLDRSARDLSIEEIEFMDAISKSEFRPDLKKVA